MGTNHIKITFLFNIILSLLVTKIKRHCVNKRMKNVKPSHFCENFEHSER
nr:MAG TPA: hypothetical protein [Caudoviricetes sp.]